MLLRDTHKEKVDEFLKICYLLADRRFVTSHGGNLAYKVEEKVILITPTRRYKDILIPEDLVFVDMEGNTLEGNRKPTGEMPMYLNLFKERPDIQSAIHCHPLYANTFAITKGTNWLMRPVFPEMVIEAGPVPVVPYGEPLTQELADNFKPFLQKYNIFLMESHGMTAISPMDLTRLMHIIDMIEVSSVSILHALANGEVKEISRKEVENLSNTMVTRKLPMIGAPGANKSLLELYYND